MERPVTFFRIVFFRIVFFWIVCGLLLIGLSGCDNSKVDVSGERSPNAPATPVVTSSSTGSPGKKPGVPGFQTEHVGSDTGLR
jgi:hypothetical protein